MPSHISSSGPTTLVYSGSPHLVPSALPAGLYISVTLASMGTSLLYPLTIAYSLHLAASTNHVLRPRLMFGLLCSTCTCSSQHALVPKRSFPSESSTFVVSICGIHENIHRCGPPLNSDAAIRKDSSAAKQVHGHHGLRYRHIKVSWLSLRYKVGASVQVRTVLHRQIQPR